MKISSKELIKLHRFQIFLLGAHNRHRKLSSQDSSRSCLSIPATSASTTIFVLEGTLKTNGLDRNGALNEFEKSSEKSRFGIEVYLCDIFSHSDKKNIKKAQKMLMLAKKRTEKLWVTTAKTKSSFSANGEMWRSDVIPHRDWFFSFQFNLIS